MGLLLIFAVTLFAAVLLSCVARQTVLSTAVLFLAAGSLYGSGWIGKPHVPNADFLQKISEIALFAVLFTDGMRTGGLNVLRNNWRMPSRALLIGMPLTILMVAVLCHLLVLLDWKWSFLIGAVLSPTDPVFVSAIFEIEAIPDSLKRLLNIESGVNDGLALPIVILLLSALGSQNAGIKVTVAELIGGIAVGVIVPWIGVALEQSRFLGATGIYEPLNAFALGLLVLTIAYATHTNMFLAAFAAGITITTRNQQLVKAFNQFGDLLAELLKLAALLILGARIASRLFPGLSLSDYVFVLLSVFVVRVIAIFIAFIRSGLSRREVLILGWFGPKGFASVVYGLMVLHLGSEEASHAAQLIALGIVASIVVYSSTDIFAGHVFQKDAPTERANTQVETEAL